MPLSLPPIISHSPAWIPARILFPQVFNRIYSRSGASNRSRWSIECSQEAITGGIDLATTMTLELLAYGAVVMTEKLFPPTITDFRRKLGGADNVREEDSSKYAIGLRPTAHAG